jgi:enamine deaminase RidA (YjgF/YER057c/UK114 family)
MTPEERLIALGIELPPVSAPAAKYTNVVQVGLLLFVSGKGPSPRDGNLPKGKLGAEYTTDEGSLFARDTGLEILAVLRDYLGSLNGVKGVVKLQGFINATPEFEEHHKVLNGCSELMLEVFGDAGLHARSVMGAISLWDNLPVIIDSVFETFP